MNVAEAISELARVLDCFAPMTTDADTWNAVQAVSPIRVGDIRLALEALSVIRREHEAAAVYVHERDGAGATAFSCHGCGNLTTGKDHVCLGDAPKWYPCACGAEHDTPTCPFGY